MIRLALLFIGFVYTINLSAQLTNILDTGGPLMPEQAAYDVHFYELSLAIDPEKRRIKGQLNAQVHIVHPMDWLVLDLDTVLQVSEIHELVDGETKVPLKFKRKIGKLWIQLSSTRQPGEQLSVTIAYGGQPRKAKRAPWDGGFTWRKTKAGDHWIATTCQTEGADLWWPNKDHVSDKPDSMAMHFTVPQGLVVASNGQARGSQNNADGTVTWNWMVTTPISNYNIALNIAPYQVVESTFDSKYDYSMPVYFWVLPEDYEKGKKLMIEIKDHLHFFEKLFGPYPFREDKYGVAQTPHLGMEHQTIIAYGANFNNKSMTRRDWGFDALHHHELAHEWWGNLVTNSDWRDMWIHEGFGSYTQALYLEEISGMPAYHEFMSSIKFFINKRPIAPREVTSGENIYRAPIYYKGAWTLHTLRYLLGEEHFFKTLRRMAYPDPASEKITNGDQTRFVTTEDFIDIAENISGKELDWFFEVYHRQPKLPVLYSQIKNGAIHLRWKTPKGLPFPMPVEVQIGTALKQFMIPAEGIAIPIPKGERAEVDPNHWILMKVSK